MISFGHICGRDLQVSGTGLSFVSGVEATKQRILRRLLTNAGGYIWHADYGAGLPQMVGDVIDDGVISASIRQSLQEDDGVDSSRPIEVRIDHFHDGTIRCLITYFDKKYRIKQSLQTSF
nr:phage tail protein [uncultured Neokomagataea sp.]